MDVLIAPLIPLLGLLFLLIAERLERPRDGGLLGDAGTDPAASNKEESPTSQKVASARAGHTSPTTWARG
jgi:hypothetical protein